MKTKFILLSATISSMFLFIGKSFAKVSPPNIIIIFLDDQGYGDLGSYGATGYETPNIDRLASQGMRFSNFYCGSAVCSPSRAALLTGCYPPRVGITRVLFPFDNIGLSQEETTIAGLVKQKGYATGMVGKWHLGHHQEFLPLQHGFDEYFGLPYSNDMWPIHYDGTPVTKDNVLREWKLNAPPLPLIDGNKMVDVIGSLEDQDMLTTRYTERAVDFIRRNHKKPFFLYIPHTMVHVPLGVSKKFRGKSEQGFYGDVMMEVDWSVGEVMKALRKHGIEKNTLVIFTSDNGPWLNYGNHGGSSGGLREGKGTPFEGGFRVPCIMRWPDVIPAGTHCSKISSTIDFLPTIAAITGATLPDKKIDGVNILSLLKGDSESHPREEFFYYSGRNLNAVRYKNWKYIFPISYDSNVGSKVGMDGFPGTLPTVQFGGGLYNMYNDPGEQYDMKNEYPEIVDQLKELIFKKRLELGHFEENINGSENREAGRIEAE